MSFCWSNAALIHKNQSKIQTNWCVKHIYVVLYEQLRPGERNAGLPARVVKDDNETVSVFATRERAAMLEANQHAREAADAELGYRRA